MKNNSKTKDTKVKTPVTDKLKVFATYLKHSRYNLFGKLLGSLLIKPNTHPPYDPAFPL